MSRHKSQLEPRLSCTGPTGNIATRLFQCFFLLAPGPDRMTAPEMRTSSSTGPAVTGRHRAALAQKRAPYLPSSTINIH